MDIFCDSFFLKKFLQKIAFPLSIFQKIFYFLTNDS